jgi:hypothetical protein
MKFLYLTSAFLCLQIVSSFSQFTQTIRYENGFGVVGPIEAVIVGPLKPIDDTNINPEWKQKERNDGRKDPKIPAFTSTEVETTPDQALQTEYSMNRTPSFTEVFNVAGFTNSGAYPPDPVSACGDLHYVVAINGGSGCQYRVYNKVTGAQIGSTVGFEATINLPGGSFGDPIVVYDDLADRWVLCEISSTGNVINVYVSQTNNITTTSWYGYQINCSGYDYPKLSVWPSAYFLTLNDGGPSVYALNRPVMLTGGATTVITRTASDLSGFGFQALAPVDFDGNNPPPANAPGILLRHRDTEAHGPGGLGSVDYLEVFEFAPNFVTPASSTWTSSPTQISVSEFSSNLNGFFAFNCFPQPGTTQELDPLRELIMNRPQYINFGTHQSIVACQVTDVDGNDRGGIRWYEIRKPASTWTLYQEGTYAPGTDAYSRWMPTISQDINQNIAICYSISHSSTIFPGLRMTARSASDPLGQMTLPEYNIVSGSSSQTGIERWGDYFCMTQDPTDWRTFYFDGEYMTTGGNWRIRNFAFNFASNALDLNMFSVNGLTSPPVCNTTSRTIDAVIRNAGTTTVTSANIRYSFNGGSLVTLPYSGSLAGGAYDTVQINLTPIVSGNNTLVIYTTNPNGSPDEDFANDTIVTNFNASFGLSATSTQVQNILCFNQNNGQISINATGGLPSYTYSIGGTYGASSTYSSIGPGTITCYVKDAAGCIDTILPALVFTNPPQITSSGSAVNASSGGATDGSITVTASGGTGTLEYNINGGTFQSSNVFNGLGAGNYTVVVRDDNGCTSTFVITIGALGVDLNPLENALRIFPNPTFGKLTINYISAFNADNATLEVFDALGKVVKSISVGELYNGMSIEVDLTGFARDIYTLRLSADKWTTDHKIVLQ